MLGTQRSRTRFLAVMMPLMAWGLKQGTGGERGIRTLDTLLTYTPLAGERLQPLGHLSCRINSNCNATRNIDHAGGVRKRQ